MAQNILTKNNARSTLLAGITSSATSLSVQAGHGARFSAPVTGEIAKLTLYDTAGNIEICHGITRSGDGWSTIVRAQEGTTARAWNAGDGIAENATAAFLNGLSQLDRTETVTAKKTFSGGISLPNGLGIGYVNNIGLAASVAGGALTVALKNEALADPSADSPVEIAFRNRTVTNGNVVIREITAAASIVLPSGGIIDNSYLHIAPINVSVASPCVITYYDADLVENQAIYLTSSGGALPTGLTDDTVYYVKTLSGLSSNVSATPGGAAINTSGSLTGTPYAYYVDTAAMYVYLCDNGTTREIGIAGRPLFNEQKLHNTTAISAAADDGFVLYTTTAMTNAAVRLIGKIELQPSLPLNSWDVAPTRVSLLTASQLTGPLVVTHAKGTSNDSLTPLPQNLGGTVQVEVGDLVTLNLFVSFTAGAGAYAEMIQYPVGGTCLLETMPLVSNPSEFMFMVVGNASLNGVIVKESFSLTRRVSKAGTFSISAASNVTYGTAVTNKRSLVSVTVVRPNR